jgi:hypothetical protein
VDAITTAWYRRQAALSLQTSRKVEALWRQVDQDRITESWLELLPQAVTITTAGQVATSTQATEYVSAQLTAQGSESQPEGKVNPLAFAGVAADGRPLESLLVLPAIASKLRIAQGLPAKDALLSGLGSLITMTSTEVADAGRSAQRVATTSDRTAQGFYRVVKLPACSRCLALAGRWYSWEADFDRHPRCDCTAIPAAEASDIREADKYDPKRAFDALTADQQDKTFGKAAAQAVRDGADVGQVVNAKRGMTLPNTGYGRRAGFETVEGRTKRGAFARRSDARARREGRESEFIKQGDTRYSRIRERRLSVDAIYWQAQGNRDEVIRMLRKYAYILD